MTRFLSIALAPLLCALALAPACQADPRVQERSAELASLAGVQVVITGVDLPQERVAEISKHLEAKAVDTGAAMVRVKKQDQDPTEVEIALFAKQLPAQNSIAADLEAAFPELAGATITVGPADAAAIDAPPLVEVGPELTPEEAKLEIVEQLQADGVEGNIDVQVHDGAGGRTVQVKVEKHQQTP